MIGYLKGIVIHVEEGECIVKVGDIGYQVHPVGYMPKDGESLELWIHDLVREDRRELYGFTDRSAKAIFEQLISINGVGHKLAAQALRMAKPEELQKHIIDGNIEFLTSLSGIGKKTAQKIILELKGVLVEQEQSAEQAVATEVIDGLKSLGYSMKDIAPHLEDLPENTEDALKEVLRRFANTMK